MRERREDINCVISELPSKVSAGNVEAIRGEGVQIVVLDAPEVYPEYEPYVFVDNMKEYIDRV